ncbi:LOW QUALITY PROTEIN: reticulon-3 [Lepisosteus oculatus]|uniref:LOW QUALITY PROTEIN: reticulon-3 n=1 Tax=Lepisosteus oculatus TaxID=7918 RepID=UPI0035F50A3C
MADASTQSSQVSSSHGAGEGSSPSSKSTDSFLSSSSPVSLIQSSQAGSRMEGPHLSPERVATSCAPVAFGGQGPPSYAQGPPQSAGDQEPKMGTPGAAADPVAPIMGRPAGAICAPSPPSEDLSPGGQKVSGAVPGQLGDPDAWADGGFLHFQERHYDKSPTDAPESCSPSQGGPPSPDPGSPESPFEVLGDTRRGGGFGREPEEDSHPPPGPETGGPAAKDTGGSGGPGPLTGLQKDAPAGAGEEPDLDLRFLPTAYIWDRPGRPEEPSDPDRPPSPSLPPSSSSSSSSSPPAEPAPWEEAPEGDSSGESDDTVIEEATPAAGPVSVARVPVPAEMAREPLRLGKLILVPVINVIETEEDAIPEEEEEEEEEGGYEIVGVPLEEERKSVSPEPGAAGPVTGSPPGPRESPLWNSLSWPPPVPRTLRPWRIPIPCPPAAFPRVPRGLDRASPLRGSLPSSRSPAGTGRPESRWPREEVGPGEDARRPAGPESGVGDTETPWTRETPGGPELPTRKSPSQAGPEEQAGLPGSPEGWDWPEPAAGGVPEPLAGQPAPRDYPGDPFSRTQDRPPAELPRFQQGGGAPLPGPPEEEEEEEEEETRGIPASPAGAEPLAGGMEEEPQPGEGSPEPLSDPESLEPECSVSAATDSFVEFMKECLKSRRDEGPEEAPAGAPAPAPPAPPPAALLDLEQERLTIRALKELGGAGPQEAPPAWGETGGAAPPPPPPPLPPPPLPLLLSEPQEGAAPAPAGEPVGAQAGAQAGAAASAQLAGHVLAPLLTRVPVRDLVYWRDPKKTGVAFGASLLLLLSLAAFSVISVASYLLLALLCVTIAFRVYKSVIQAVQKSGEGHPFKAYMDQDVSVSPETFRKYVDAAVSHVNAAVKQLSRLFLVEDLVDSLKLAVLMWLMTYVGAVFNGITLLIMADILVFSVPVFYEKYQSQIDHYVGIVRDQVKATVSKVQEKLPGAAKHKAE